ncbi:hypothetical protein Ccrd_024647 [Cynara cardunculus var. scolymus]|uniref:Uncharacterized protein n=1 Tax=Cynara cardunculus var. scolymus TaxID=59895 RepID=A0A103XC46_CYNCS|nr:hypothetical protein Ccrd_024647 [Cynara cardunculus var. scolymus]
MQSSLGIYSSKYELLFGKFIEVPPFFQSFLNSDSISAMTGVCQLVAIGRIDGDVACQTTERDSHVYGK